MARTKHARAARSTPPKPAKRELVKPRKPRAVKSKSPPAKKKAAPKAKRAKAEAEEKGLFGDEESSEEESEEEGEMLIKGQLSEDELSHRKRSALMAMCKQRGLHTSGTKVREPHSPLPARLLVNQLG